MQATGTSGWQRKFDDPIPLPSGRKLRTLRDAANYITKLPKSEHNAPEWRDAIEALMLVAEYGGPTMFARIGVMRALQGLDCPPKGAVKKSPAPEAPGFFSGSSVHPRSIQNRFYRA
jgi:hypothetical protein